MSNATHSLKLQHTLLIMALAAAYPMQALAAASAGIAQFITGDVNVRRPDGKTDPLVKGKDIESGEAIVTGTTGRAQVRFTDGGLISLQPNTEFKIANYVDQADPKQDRFLVDLLRGSMRAITGLIGKRNRENYKVTTTTATIGIRGSGFSAGYFPDGSLGVTTELDAIEVCNAGGCVGLVAGESVRVINSTDTPVRTVAKAPVPTPAPQQDTENSGNKTSSDGKAEIVTTTKSYQAAVADAAKSGNSSNSTNTPSTLVDSKTVNTGTLTNLKVVTTGFLQGISGPAVQTGLVVASSATLDDGKLTSLTASGKTFTPSTTNGVASAGSISAGDFIGWGTWTAAARNPGGSALSNLHYIVGQPTLTMPASGTAAYTVLGQTPVTSYVTSTGIAGVPGTLTSASLSVDFTNSKLGVVINTTLGNINIASVVNIANAQFSYSSGTGIFVDGIFTGVNANRAGLVYTAPILSIGSFSGAVVFKAP